MYGLALVLLLAFLWVALVLTRKPGHEGEWGSLQTRLPVVSRPGTDLYQIRHIRDFRYHPDGTPHLLQYRDDAFDSNHLEQVWLGISHFGPLGMAHTFLSFEFTGQRFLVASVEARLYSSQVYGPLQGLLRRFHKMVVLGTEADVIGLRTHVRNERVLLYPLQLDEAARKAVWQAMMADVMQLENEPAFYNTLTDNCLTNLLKHTPGYRPWQMLLDYRLLLPGFADGMAYDKGWINTRRSLADLREQARVDATRTRSDAEDFSLQIRCGWQQEENQPAEARCSSSLLNK